MKRPFGDIKAGMNSCRESIEWMYRDLKIMWAITSTKYMLKLLNDFINTDNIVYTCLIFDNAWNCMNGNETSQYFKSTHLLVRDKFCEFYSNFSFFSLIS